MWPFFILIISNSLSQTYSETDCKIPNTGSVLFRSIDAHRKHCWSQEEIALLYTRRAMVELVPKRIPFNINLILEFIKLCLATLQEEAPIKEVYDYMLSSFADVFGGYLQTYGLPLLYEAYYEGHVSYDNVAECHLLQEHLKSILMTNGVGWTKPTEIKKHINQISPLKIPIIGSSKSCSLIFTINTHQSSASEELSSSNRQSKPLIPLPVLDDNKQPNSIAIPLRSHALFNLKSRRSYEVLRKYYTESSRCISQTKVSDVEQINFDRVFSNWLNINVIPHLKSETWYVGFSNVLRIEETIQQRKRELSASERGVPIGDESLFTELEEKSNLTKVAWIVIAVIILMTIIFICFLYWTTIKNFMVCCGKMVVKSSRDRSSGDPSERLSVVSASSDYSNAPMAKGKDTRRTCRHKRNISNLSNPDLPFDNLNYYKCRSTLSDESHLTLSRGKCPKHQ